MGYGHGMGYGIWDMEYGYGMGYGIMGYGWMGWGWDIARIGYGI